MEAKGKRAFIGACIGMIANMGMNSMFTIFLVSFVMTWPESNIATIALAATFGCLTAAILSTFFAGKIFTKIQARTLYLICAILAVLYCFFHATASAVWMVILPGFFGGATLALGTHAAGVTTVSPYLGTYKNPGTTISIVMACTNLGAAAFSILASRCLAAGMFWQKFYIVLGVIVVAMNLIAFFLVPKVDMSGAAAAAAAAGAGAEAEPQPGLTSSQAFKTLSFWLVFIGILLISLNYQGICTYLISFFTAYGLDQSAASNMQAIMQLVGIIFVAFGGVIIAKLGTKGLYIACVIPMAIGGILLAYGFPKAPTMALAIVCAVLLVTGALVTNICPLTTPILFGPRDLNKINPIFAGGAFWGGTTLASQVVGRTLTATGSYQTAFIVATVLGIVGLVLLFIALGAKPKWENA